ncbi:MAG TPA: fatty acid hydroxylase, partial [Chitinophaga sp.]
MPKNYISNSSESTRMFKNGFLESLSKVHFSVPLIIYVPVVIYFSWKALFQMEMGILLFIGCYAGGLF